MASKQVTRSDGQLLTEQERAKLLRNGAATARGERRDALPLVKLITPDYRAVWLLTEIDPADCDTAYGLCDAGIGWPQLGTISIQYLESMKGPDGYLVTRDPSFLAKWPISEYVRRAQAQGAVVD